LWRILYEVLKERDVVGICCCKVVVALRKGDAEEWSLQCVVKRVDEKVRGRVEIGRRPGTALAG
jgi:hypothetical protein